MIDTCRGKIQIPWKPDVFNKIVPDWEMTQKELTDKDGNKSISWSAIHTDGMYIAGNEEFARIIQCSLPRIIFKDNTNLIKNQSDLDISFDKMRLLMLQVLEYDAIPQWTRLDLVWNYIGYIDEFIAIFRHTKHPLVRNPTRVYDGESISWKGRKSEIQIYDKLKEKKFPGLQHNQATIIRAELRKSIPPYRGTDLKKDLTLRLCTAVMGGYLPTFEKCYSYYREQLVLLSPITIPQLSERSPIGFLAYLQANGMRDPQGTPLVDIYLNKKSRASKYRIKRQLKAQVLTHKLISFNAMLPEEKPPVPVGYRELASCA